MPKKTVNCPRCGHHESEHLASARFGAHCTHKEYGPVGMRDGWLRQGPILRCDCDLSVDEIYLNLRGQTT